MGTFANSAIWLRPVTGNPSLSRWSASAEPISTSEYEAMAIVTSTAVAAGTNRCG